jgi:hypothetical protein
MMELVIIIVTIRHSYYAVSLIVIVITMCGGESDVAIVLCHKIGHYGHSI